METKKFKWMSWLGLSVILFLLYGVFNVVMAIVVPTNLHKMGANAMGGLVVSTAADSKVLGMDLAHLPKGVSDYLVTFMDTMCMMMMGMGILHVALAWFGLRTGQLWTLWTMSIADISFIPYWHAIANVFARYGVPAKETWGAFSNFFIMIIVVLIVALVAGLVGLKRQKAITV